MSGNQPPPSDGDPGREISDHVNDYLESLRARFNELSDRIEEASRASIDRGRAELEDLIATGRGVAHPIADVAPITEVTPVAAGEPVARGDGDAEHGGAPGDATPETNDVTEADHGAVVPEQPQGWNTRADSPAHAEAGLHVGGSSEPEWDPAFESSPIAARLRSMHAREAASQAQPHGDLAAGVDEASQPTSQEAMSASGDTADDPGPRQRTSDLLRSRSGGALARPAGDHDRVPRRWVTTTLLVLIALAAAFLAGRWWSSRTDGQVATPTTLPSPPASTAAPTEPSDVSIAAAVESAVAALAPGTVSVTVEDGVVALSGTVADASARDALSSVTLAIAGVRQLDNRVRVAGNTPPPSDEDLQAAADAARQAAGFEHLDVTVVDGVATISGVVPVETVADGVFGSVAPLRDELEAIEGIDEVVTRVQLRGDEAALRADLKELTDEAPIIFASNSADLDAAATASLDRAAEIIISYPGLRVLIAGHTDAAGGTAQNEALAAARGQAVLGYLISKGVPVTRLQVVSYGELFPEAGAEQSLNRRIEFEVAP